MVSVALTGCYVNLAGMSSLGRTAEALRGRAGRECPGKGPGPRRVHNIVGPGKAAQRFFPADRTFADRLGVYAPDRQPGSGLAILPGA